VRVDSLMGGCLRGWSGQVREVENLFSFSRIELKFLVLLARSLVTILTELYICFLKA